jgi:hypothetical protein
VSLAESPIPPLDGTRAGVAQRATPRGERIFLFLLALLTVVVVAGHMRPYLTRDFVPTDFGAFYCGGKTVLQRQDPYRVQPLLDCERRLAAVDRRWNSNLIEGVSAVPLPGYAFLPLAALAMLPPRLAVLVFGFLLLAATAVIGYCLARMSALPLSAAFAVAFIGIGYNATALGQIAPFAIASVAAGALLLRLGKQRWAVLAASAALIQPQFGLPIMISSFLFLPRVRILIGLIVLTLTLGTFVTVGTRGAIEYPSFLSIHARSEVNSPYQYSLTWVAHTLGADAKTALAAGEASYLLLLVTCLLVLARSGNRGITTGAVILLPAAFSVFGGTFIHDHQIAVALIAAIVLVQPASTILTTVLGAALLTVPYGAMHTLNAIPSLLLTVLAAWCVVFFPMRGLGMRTAIQRATATVILISAILATILVLRPTKWSMLHGVVPIVHQPAAIASLEAQHVLDDAEKYRHTPLLYFFLLKLPTWCGLAITLWYSSRMLSHGGKPAAQARWSTLN